MSLARFAVDIARPRGILLYGSDANSSMAASHYGFENVPAWRRLSPGLDDRVAAETISLAKLVIIYITA
jgi:hypothetical protein